MGCLVEGWYLQCVEAPGALLCQDHDEVAVEIKNKRLADIPNNIILTQTVFAYFLATVRKKEKERKKENGCINQRQPSAHGAA